ncbi:tetratricopeptide repeat protein [bacterium]|nr:tetratricopeptide repeat protein [bacterium]
MRNTQICFGFRISDLLKLFTLLLIAILLQIPLQTYHYAVISSVSVIPGGEIVSKILGGVFTGSADLLWLKADEYLHKGVTEHGHCHILEEADMGEHTQHKHEHNHKEIEHRHKLEYNRLDKLFAKLEYNLKPNITEHLHSKRENELMPWFKLATIFNPHHVRAYAVGGYWLAFRLGKLDEAIKFMAEGIKNNPDSYQIAEEMGIVYFSKLKDYKKAQYYFERALKSQAKMDEYDKAGILRFLAFSHKFQGHTQKAIDCYKQVLRLFPENKKAKNFIDKWERGKE